MKNIYVGAIVVASLFFSNTASAQLTVPDGGTGATSFTQGYFLLGNGTDPIIASSSPSALIDLFYDLFVPAGSNNEVQFNDNGVFGANSHFTFFPSRINPPEAFASPTLQIGADNTAALRLYMRYPDPATYVVANSALPGSGNNGTQLLLSGGNADGNSMGGGTWLLSGAGAGTGRNGDINIYANNNSPNDKGGNITLNTTRANLVLSPEDGAFSISTGSGKMGTDQGLTMTAGAVNLTSPFGLTIVNPGTGAIAIDGERYMFQAIRHDSSDPETTGAMVGAVDTSTGFLNILSSHTLWKLANEFNDDGAFNMYFNNDIFTNGGDNYSDSLFKITTTGDVTVVKHLIFGGSTPTVASGSADCGANPSIVGTDNAARITVGTGANGNRCTITFAEAWDNPPICIAEKETNNSAVRATNVTTTGFEIVGQIGPSQSLVFQCMGY